MLIFVNQGKYMIDVHTKQSNFEQLTKIIKQISFYVIYFRYLCDQRLFLRSNQNDYAVQMRLSEMLERRVMEYEHYNKRL